MAKVLSYSFTDTPISGVTSLNFSRGLVNFGADFRVKSDEPSEVIMTNLTSPVVYPEKVRISCSDVANVYTGSSIEPSLYAPTKRGVSLLVQLNEVLKVTDSTVPEMEIALPAQVHFVIKVPNHELITPAVVEKLLGRAISCLYETGTTSSTRMTALLRGSLKPSDI